MQTYASDIFLHDTARVRRGTPHAALWLLACFGAAAMSCSASTQLAPSAGYALQLGAEHPLLGQVYAGQARKPVATSVLLGALERARYVVLGESHDNPDHHQLQARLLQHFLGAQPSAAVAFEMLDEDDASTLAQAAANLSSAQLAERVDWAHSGWPEFALYKPVFDVALAAHARIVAAHPNAGHVRASVRGVDEAEARDLHIDTPLPQAQMKAQLEEIRESHCGHDNSDMLAGMQQAQVYKDAFMARALARTGAPTALIAGRGHARNDRAVPYFVQRMQAGTTLSVGFVEVDDRQLDAAAYDAAAFDFVVFTPRVSDADPCEEFRKQLEQMRQHPPAAAD